MAFIVIWMKRSLLAKYEFFWTKIFFFIFKFRLMKNMFILWRYFLFGIFFFFLWFLSQSTYECLEIAISKVKPGELYRNIGNYITKHASDNKLSGLSIPSFSSFACLTLFVQWFVLTVDMVWEGCSTHPPMYPITPKTKPSVSWRSFSSLPLLNLLNYSTSNLFSFLYFSQDMCSQSSQWSTWEGGKMFSGLMIGLLPPSLRQNVCFWCVFWSFLSLSEMDSTVLNLNTHYLSPRFFSDTHFHFLL